jgi:hypothetical protein
MAVLQLYCSCLEQRRDLQHIEGTGEEQHEGGFVSIATGSRHLESVLHKWKGGRLSLEDRLDVVTGFRRMPDPLGNRTHRVNDTSLAISVDSQC